MTIVDPVSVPYRPIAVRAGGVVSGGVRFTGDAPEDTAVNIRRDTGVCGNNLRQSTVEVSGDRVVGAIVWLADIRSGRALPLARRFELVQTRCTFGPVLQAAIAGGTLNVRTQDPIVSRTVVVDARTLDTVAVLPFNSSGSVVPLDAQLRGPALLEVRSITHPWIQAWVVVVDHPYFATTERDGTFIIPDVPAGRYQVKAWHPRFGLATGSATVTAGGNTRLELRFDPGAPGADSAVVAARP